MIFEKPSTRTRVFFEVGTWQPDGYAFCLEAGEFQLGQGEKVINEVADSKNSVIFDQVENRMHTQKTLMALTM